ncbi:hypothetical protein EST38_g6618, partial [Candolleomyces aberdarensis]
MPEDKPAPSGSTGSSAVNVDKLEQLPAQSKRVTFVKPPPMTLNRAPIEPIRLPRKRPRSRPTPYTRSLSNSHPARSPQEGTLESPTKQPSVMPDPFAAFTEYRQRVESSTASARKPTSSKAKDESDGVIDVEQVENVKRMLSAAKKGRNAIAQELTREEREELKRQRTERLTSVTRPLDIEDREYFLGYALIDVVNPHDGGKGPGLLPSPYRRPFSNKQLRTLRASAGKDGRGLRTTDHEHALVVAAPSHFIDETQLSQSPYGPHRRVHWLPGALEETMVLLAGSHRQKTSEDITAEHQREILKIGTQADRAKSKGNTRKAEELEKTVDKMRKAMDPKVVWLAMIYDRDGILENRRQSGPALLKLITNNRVAPQPETEAHELARVFRLAHNGGAPTTSDILGYISTLNSTRNDAYRRLAQRGGDFLSFVIGTRLSHHFDNFYTDSAKIVSVQTEVWGLVSPIIKFMWNQLLFVCSNTPAPESNGPITEGFCVRLVRLIQSHDPDKYISRPVLDTLVNMADSSFNEHFSGEFLRIGMKDEAYYNSYCDYAQEILQHFREAVRESRLKDPGKWTAQDEEVALAAPAKLRLILLKHTTLHAPGAPILDNPTPLLSPMCAATMIDDWCSCQDSVFMVSSWFMPGLTHIHTVVTNGAMEKSPLTSYPSVIRAFLEYYLGFGTQEDWNTQDPATMLTQIFDNGDEEEDVELGQEIVDTILSVMIQLLWRYREPILRPSQRLLPPIPRGRITPNRSGDDNELSQHVAKMAPQFLKQWRKDLARHTGQREKNVTPRLDPDMPDTVRSSIDTYQENIEETRLLAIFETLEALG